MIHLRAKTATKLNSHYGYGQEHRMMNDLW